MKSISEVKYNLDQLPKNELFGVVKNITLNLYSFLTSIKSLQSAKSALDEAKSNLDNARKNLSEDNSLFNQQEVEKHLEAYNKEMTLYKIQQGVVIATGIEIGKSFNSSEMQQVAISGTRLALNITSFLEKMDESSVDPLQEPQLDISLAFAIVADLTLVFTNLIQGVSEITNTKIKGPAMIWLIILDGVGEGLTAFSNNLVDINGQSKVFTYLEDGLDEEMGNDWVNNLLTELLRSDILEATYNAIANNLEMLVKEMIEDWLPDSLQAWNQQEFERNFIVGNGEDNHLSGLNSKKNIIQAFKGADSLYGGELNDYLYGGFGNDYFDGKGGDDILIDSEGNDHYIFSANFGHDTIYDKDGKGLIQIDGFILSGGEKINDNEWKSSDDKYIISLIKDTDSIADFNSLFIYKNGNKENSITIKNWKNGDLGITLEGLGQTSNQTEGQYVFANDGNNIIYNQKYVYSAGGNDLISSSNDNDIIISGIGNDLINSHDGDDTIYAGEGKDIIYTGGGRDTIYGEGGDDLILSSSSIGDSRSTYLYWFNKQNSSEDPLVESFDGLDFIFEPELNEKNEVESFYITDEINKTYQILPLFDLYYTTPNGNKYYFNIINSLNWGAGYSGGDIIYGGGGNDIIMGSSDTDYIYGGEDDDNLYALNGNDIVYGGQGKDIIYGGDGVDHIYGGVDDDHIVGGHDKDYLHGGDGDDVIEGDLQDLRGTEAPPEGADYSRFGDDEIYGGKGEDKIWGNLGNDHIWGGENNDRISGDHHAISGSLHGNDVIRGEEGDDTIWGDGGEDEIYGGDGNDQIQGDNSTLEGEFHKRDIISGGNGDDKIWGNGGNDYIDGDEGNDYIQGDYSDLDGQYHGDDEISGGVGNDTIFGDGGSDKIKGDEGDDYLDGDNINLDGQYHGKDEIFGGEGNDTIFGQGNEDVIYGGNGDDYIEGDNTKLEGEYHGNDIIYAEGGNDTIYGNGGDDELYGGNGDDYLAGDQKNNRELDGHDKLYGGSGKDTLLGFDGDDILDGGEGDDIVFGGNGNDTIYSYEGNDQLAGGNGDDTYHIRVRDAEVKILDSSNENHVYLEGEFDFSKVKLYWYTNAVSLITPTLSSDLNAVFPQFTLTFFDDSETQPVVDENGEMIEGETLKDEYGNSISGGYDQYLHFDLGSNAFQAFSSARSITNEYVIHLDTYLKERAGISYQLWTGSWYGIQAPYLIFTNGYIKNNNLIYEGSKIGDSLDIEQIRNNVDLYGEYQADEYHLLDGDDEVQGSSSKDIIYGGTGDDIIHSKDGNDELYGDEGNDQLFGEAGNDLIYGGEGDDQLFGDTGDDIVYGGEGNDHLSGGTGNDQLYGNNGNDIIYGGIGQDILFGESGNDQLFGDDGNDQIFGGQGNDILYGGEGADIINGGEGDNILIGGKGIDEYVFDALDGNNQINDTDETILRFNNIDSKSVRLEVSGNDLNIYYNESSSVKILDFIVNGNVKEVYFKDTIWSKEDLNKKITINQYGDSTNNDISGIKHFNNNIYAEAGDDRLYGGGLDNNLYGGEGNDIFELGYSDKNSENYFYGGEGYDSYNVKFGRTTWIKDEDYSGIINVDSGVYFTLVGNVFTQSPNRAEKISTQGDHSYYKYSLNNSPLLQAEYNAEIKTFSLTKNGEFLFGFKDLNSISDLNLFNSMDIQIGGEEVYHTIGTYSHYYTTKFNLVDFFNSFNEIKSIYGNGDDFIEGYGNLNNIIYAGNGQNIITTGSGNDIIYGGQNNDEIHAGDGNNIIVSGDGGDMIVVGNGRNTITSGSGNDQIWLGYGDNNVSTGAGNDYIYGGYGHIDAGSGDDVILGVGGSIYGGQGNDTIIASDAGAYMDGGEGADHLVGGLGDDTYIVDEFDTIEEHDVDGGYDTIHIARDFDLALNNLEAVTLLGDQNLNAYGDEFTNILIGNIGNNYLDGRTGSDYMMGGAGDDYYVIDTVDKIEIDEYGNSYLVEGDRVVEYGSEGIDTVERWVDDLYIREDQNGNLIQTNLYKTLQDNIENLVLKGQAKVAFGNDLDNIITLNENDNYVDGGRGNDTYVYSLGGGKDTLIFKDSIEAFNSLIINGFDESQIYARQLGNHLTINFKDHSKDQIIINNYFIEDDLENDISYKPKEIKLSNGFVLDAIWINHSLHNLEGTDGDDSITGLSRSENIYGGFGNDGLWGQGGNDTIYGGAGSDYLEGNEGDDVLHGEEGNDTLFGGAGNDSLYGGIGGDQLRGGSGIDLLDGGAGNDEYLYYLGDGPDVIDQTGGGTDVIWLMDRGITEDRITFKKENNDLLILIDNNENQSIRVKDHFLGGEKAISAVQPNDGYPITAKDIEGIIKAQAYGGLYDIVLEGSNSSETINGSERNDLIQGLNGNDTIWAQGGNDTIYGGAGSDYLEGNEGDDVLHGEEGNDTLFGGAGNDSLYGGIGGDQLRGGSGIDLLDGGAGNDEYLYYLGDGPDVIDQTGGGTDVIWLMDRGITEDRITFKKENNDLLILIDNNENQSIRVKDHFLGGEKAISAVQPNDGYIITAAQIAVKVNSSEGGAGTLNPIGDTTYNYTSGTLTITEQSGIDKVVFASNISFNQVSNYLTISGDDLILKVNGSSTNKVVVKNFFLAGNYLVETFKFATGEEITAEQIFALAGMTLPSTGGDTGAGSSEVAGDTTYNYTSGTLTITEQSGIDKVVFASNISFNQVSNYLTISGDDLILKVNGSSTNKVVVKNFFLAGNYLVETFKFATGEEITAEQIFALAGMTLPSTGGDTGAGSSEVAGDTTYNYTSGTLTITEQSGIDKVVFASNISFNQVSNYLTISGDDLILKVNGSSTNKVVVKNFFLAGNYLVETFKFATGEEITAEQIFALAGMTLPSTGGDTDAGSSEVAGDTTYNYTSGTLTITEQSGIDKVVFASNISFNQVSNYLTISGDDLILKVNGSSTNKVVVKNFFLAGNYLVETFKFATGEEITAEQIFALAGMTLPSTGGDTGAGSSEVEGNTIYEYTTGTLIIDESSGNDKVIFKNGITFNQIGQYLTLSGNDLILKLNDSDTNKVVVKNFFIDGNKVVETFEFETGGVITASQIFGAFGITMPVTTASSNRTVSDMESVEAVNNTTYEYTGGELLINEKFGVDTVVFKNNITFNDVASYFTRSDTDLILKVKGSDIDKVVVKNFFLGGAYEVESFSFETGGSISSTQIYQAYGLSKPLNAEDNVQSIVIGDSSDNSFTSEAETSELFILNEGQDILTLLQNASDMIAVDYVSDFKITEDQLDISDFLEDVAVNSSNLSNYLNISYDGNLKTNTISISSDGNTNYKEVLVLTNQSEQLSVHDLLLNQTIIY